MKNLSITGIVLLSIAILLFYLTTDGFTTEQIGLPHVMGIMGGVGIGLIIGGIVGYSSKGTAIKEEQRRKEYKQLQQEKADIELKAQQIAQREAELDREQNKNPQI